MSDEHSLEQLLREAKDKDDLNAAVVDAEQRKTSDLAKKGAIAMGANQGKSDR
jgi:hypothetical protein